MPSPDASHATSNGLKKSGRRSTRVLVILSFISLKDLDAVSVHAKDLFLRQSVMGATMVLKSNETTIKGSQSMKAPNIPNGLRLRPVNYSTDFVLVDENTLR